MLPGFVHRTSLLTATAIAAAMAMPARAADKSIPAQIQGAFETVVIDATKAAKQATAAAEEALTKSERKSRNKKARKKPDEPSSSDTAKSETAGDPKQEAKPAAEPTADAPAKSDKAAAPETKDAKAEDKGEDKAAAGDKTATEKSSDGSAEKKPAIPTEWPAVDVELAKARCTQLLKGVDAVTMVEAPFRKGDCGSLAPVRLLSIGKSPEISFSPPPVVSCDMVVALVKWMKQDVQPAAKRHLGSEVIAVESMSDYSCRMAYGRVGNKLSEHGKANALDIRGFKTRKGEEAVVLEHWGATKRDVKRQIAEAKAAAAKAEAIKVAAEQASKERAEQAEYAAKAETTDTPLPRKTLVEGLPPKKDQTPGLALPAAMVKEGTFDSRTHLGGPKEAGAKSERKRRKEAAARKGKTAIDETVAALPAPGAEDLPIEAPKPATPTAKFLHETHAAACRIFGTTLGPEVNEAHRNHFHVDMAERKVRKICD